MFLLFYFKALQFYNQEFILIGLKHAFSVFCKFFVTWVHIFGTILNFKIKCLVLTQNSDNIGWFCCETRSPFVHTILDGETRQRVFLRHLHEAFRWIP